MVAEIPDHCGGGLGRMVKGRNGLNGGSMVGLSKGGSRIFVCMTISTVKESFLNIFKHKKRRSPVSKYFHIT